jgi:hypothetical protein
MNTTALAVLVLGAAPMLARAWHLNESHPRSESSLKWLMGACICIAFAAGILQSP